MAGDRKHWHVPVIHTIFELVNPINLNPVRKYEYKIISNGS